jgi:disease resistance protein RPM1
MPDEIKGTKALEVFETSLDRHQSTILFGRGLGDLTNLRKLRLDVSSYETQTELVCSLRKLAKGNLRFLDISREGKLNNLVEELNLPAECSLKELWLWGHSISKVPRWIGSLVNVQKLSLRLSSPCQEDLEILGRIPDLRYIFVRNEHCPSAEQLKAGMKVLMEAHPKHPTLVWRQDGPTVEIPLILGVNFTLE